MKQQSIRTILSLEQALAMPYATERFVQLGWRVIRIESAEYGGDPNRYIGDDTGADGLKSYFIAPNVGKEAITLNLKSDKGKELLKTIIKELNVDIFMCNTLPKRYKQLGIDYETLKQANPDLIWCGISALGPDYPDRAGYDPALQALLGYMYLTGEPDRDPMLCGLPLIDLKAGDEAFARVLLALLEQKEGAGGKEIFISMAECMTSWLITALPELEFNPDPDNTFTRSGNEHRSFIPCNCYPTKDGYVYLAIGSDSQWAKFTKIKGFEHAAKPNRQTNEGRKKDKDNIYSDIRRGAINYSTDDFIKVCIENNLAVAPVNSIRQVSELEYVKNNMVKTIMPDGRKVSLFPSTIDSEFMAENNNELSLSPGLGEHNNKILSEAGLSADEIEKLRAEKVI